MLMTRTTAKVRIEEEEKKIRDKCSSYDFLTFFFADFADSFDSVDFADSADYKMA